MFYHFHIDIVIFLYIILLIFFKVLLITKYDYYCFVFFNGRYEVSITRLSEAVVICAFSSVVPPMQGSISKAAVNSERRVVEGRGPCSKQKNSSGVKDRGKRKR
jgi:hypothetical protein